MSDPHPKLAAARSKRSLVKKISEFLYPGPNSPEELLHMLGQAHQRNLISADMQKMIEGVISVADKTAAQVMVAAPRMNLIDINATVQDILDRIIDIAHSRYPVFEGNHENIIGVLLAKDLFKLQRNPDLHLRDILRPLTYVPETKRLADLLRDFRNNRSHLALVIDEFGRTAGLITIEDVLEEIVGEIEDEFDSAQQNSAIVALPDGAFKVNGNTAVEHVSQAFRVNLRGETSDDQFDTIGGLIAHAMGRVPGRGESHDTLGLRFEVIETKAGAVQWFKVQRLG